MTLTPDDLKTVVAIIAVGVSFLSLWVTGRNWREANRPIVTAYLEEHHPGNVGTAFNLVVSNTGNRPAVNVRLLADGNDLDKLLHPSAAQRWRDNFRNCFSSESAVPVIRNGEHLTTSFGYFSKEAENDPCLNYGAQIDIAIKYDGLDGKSFESRLPLKVYARTGFGGGVWSDPK